MRQLEVMLLSQIKVGGLIKQGLEFARIRHVSGL
jgi:hypothetical protein